jgi:DNA-binding transcriptional MerR regulator
VTPRSYLSIGDVLTLLRQEFPDVTISKIRFLESQGLVNPERTPSGYRKFYEHDVERLRWVLRQQREHFLPLKVIKDRLDDDAVDPVTTGPSPGSGAEAAAAEAEGPADGLEDPVEHHAEEPVLVGHRATSVIGVGSAAPTGAVGEGPTLPGIEPALHSAPAPGVPRPSAAPSATSPNGPTAAAFGLAADTPGSRPDRTAVSGSAEDVAPAGKSSSRTPARSPISGSAADPPARRSTTTRRGHDDPAAPAGPPSATAAKPEAAPQGASPPPARPDPAATDVDGASLSIEELSAACGLDATVLAELQEYGLLTSTSVAGLEYFDEEALAVATLAAGFARFGIEPRHLRLYKNAADREAGFVEQILLPLVRQRNPEARARAHETADELAGLGQQLRSALLRTALADLLNS